MGFVPKNARWYLAEIVLEHIIESDRRNLVHVNSHLIRAASPEKAYGKANELGRVNRLRYTNTDGKQVRVRFRGLRELRVVHDELEDGVELGYEEATAVPESKLRRWTRPKRELAVFAPRRARRGGPNYMPLTVMRQLEGAGFTRAEVAGKKEHGRKRRRPSSRNAATATRSKRIRV
jgi:hypothetical protein